MTAPKALRDVIVSGREFDVTNHYIQREDHPRYGTRRESVGKANSAAFYLGRSRLVWPTLDRFTVTDDGIVTLYGYGAAQKPDDLFMTLVPVEVST